MSKSHLSEDDFKVAAHCCTITIPAIKTLKDSIDFSNNEEAKSYLAQHYGISNTTDTAPQKTSTCQASAKT